MKEGEESVNLNFKDLFEGDKKLTFLVGAGCSIDPPSCLSAGYQMMEAIINYTCDESEKEKIFNLEGLRFETLVEIIRDNLDEELKLIDYFGLCDRPNNQHLFLAEMIKKGHFVMTTNFDFLIEHALLQSGVSKDDVIPVITRADFEKYHDPTELLQNGKKTLYKIHGSTKNIITGENTRDSLITTIQAFGSNKEGLNVFQVESFKRPLFNNITNGRTLIIMGYSGSDDFDIVPTLKVIKNLKNVIWLNFIFDDKGNAIIHEIDIDLDPNFDKHYKVNQILTEIKRMNEDLQIFRIDVNTSRIINELLEIKSEEISFAINPIDWIKKNIKIPNKLMKFQIPYRIYRELNEIDGSLRCAEEVLRIAQDSNDPYWKATALNNIGMIYFTRGDYQEALLRLGDALQIENQLGNLSGKAILLNNIAGIYDAQCNYQEALKWFEEALRIDEQLENYSSIAVVLNNIGEIYQAQGKYNDALKRYKDALKIAESLGDLPSRSTYLNNIAGIYDVQGRYDAALKQYEEALKIDEMLGNLFGKAMILNNIAWIHDAKGNYPEALRLYEEALKIDSQLGNLSGKANRLNNIGDIYRTQGDHQKAMKFYEKAFKINEQLGNLSGMAAHYNNKGLIYYEKGNYSEALKHHEKALEIYERLGDLLCKATLLNNIANIYNAKKDYPKALKRYQEALEVDEQLGNLSGKAVRLNNIGEVYLSRANYPVALEKFEDALQIVEKLGDLSGKAIILNNIGAIYYERGNYPKALKLFEEVLQIDEQLENLFGKASRLNNMANAHDALGNYQEALKLYEEALVILTQIGLDDAPLANLIKKNIKINREKSSNNFL